MTERFEGVTKEKMISFPEEKSNTTTSEEPRLEMIGNFGDSTPQKNGGDPDTDHCNYHWVKHMNYYCMMLTNSILTYVIV